MVRRFLLLLFSFSMCLLSLQSFAVKQQPKLTLNLSKQTVWQREQVIVTLEVTTNDLLARLDKQIFTQNGLSIIPFELEQREQNDQLYLSYRWAIFPISAGDHTLEFPRIRFRPNSGRPIKLDLPKRIITVKPLPIYVPPTMPVGEITLENNWENGVVISSKKLFEWSVTANSKQVAPQTLPAISRLLNSSKSLTVFPPKRRVRTIKNKHGVSHQQHYDVPVKAIAIGNLALPKLAIQYFDPKTAKLKWATAKQPFVLVLNKWLLWIIGLLLVVFSLILIKKVALKFRELFSLYQSKKLALKALREATNYPETREALRQYAIAKNWGDNITLSRLGLHSNNKTKELIDQLQRYEFSRDGFKTNGNIQLKLIAQKLAIALK